MDVIYMEGNPHCISIWSNSCAVTYFFAVGNVDDFHLDGLAVEHELLAVAQVCKSGDLMTA